ncbi:MAG: xylulokinase, partial [Planctomycetes bacterium]|nr:xylulokinase [Planctomycetota bacterium]
KINPKEIKGIGLSGQMLGAVIIDKNHNLIRPAIIWADQRTISQCEIIRQRISEDKCYRITGNPIATGYTAPILLWLKENEPENYKKIHKFLLAKDFIRLKLTGIVATEPSDASSTLLFDTFRRRWSTEILSRLDIPEGILPRIYESLSVTGEVTAKAAKETGLCAGIPVAGGGGDQPAGAVGLGLVKSGMVVSTIATGGQVNTCVEEGITDFDGRRVHTFRHVIPGRMLLDSGTLTAGESLRWFRDNFGQTEKVIGKETGQNDFELLCRQAEKITVGSEGLIFLPYLAGEHTPHMDPLAKGVFIGFTQHHSRAHFIRSIMEGVVYSLRDCLEIYKELGFKIDRVLIAGGGAKNPLWRQIQADIFGRDLWVSNIEEHSPYGAAIIAGVSCGIFKDIEQTCQKFVRYTLQTSYVRENSEIYNNYFQIYRKVYPRLKDIFIELENKANVQK